MLSNGVTTLDVAYVLTAASFAIILCRSILRRLKNEKFQPDDYLMIAATVLYAMNTTVYPVVVTNGNNISVKNPSKLSPEEVQQVILGSKFVLLGRPFYMSYVWSMKACILIYYTRLTSRTKELRLVKIVAVILGLTWAMCMWAIFLDCRPVELYWQVLPRAPQCARAIAFVIVMGSTNMATDLMIMLIPLPIIFRAKLPLRRKIEISAVFLVGIFVLIVSIMRMVIVLADLTQQNKLMWGQLECFSATIVANAPILHGLYRHGRSHFKSTSRGSRTEPSLPADTDKPPIRDGKEVPGIVVTLLEDGPSVDSTEGTYPLGKISKPVKNWRKPDDDTIWNDSQRLDLERQFDSWQESNTESQQQEWKRTP